MGRLEDELQAEMDRALRATPGILEGLLDDSADEPRQSTPEEVGHLFMALLVSQARGDPAACS